MDPQFDVKEQIRDAVDIVELVSRYVPSLRRQGRLYTGRCPWHDDSRPSLQVNPERQTFKCWVCDIGGDIFTFVEKIDPITRIHSIDGNTIYITGISIATINGVRVDAAE